MGYIWPFLSIDIDDFLWDVVGLSAQTIVILAVLNLVVCDVNTVDIHAVEHNR